MDKWRIFGAAVVCAAVLVLAACTPGREPVVTESPSVGVSATASASPTPSASPSALTTAELLAQLPEGATSPGLDGAITTAAFFLQQYAPMFATGDTALWDALSGPDCGYCADASANATRVLTEGWTATGGEITPNLATEDSAMDCDARAVVSFDSNFSDAYLARDGATPELQEPASQDTVYLQMLLKDGVWRVNGVMIGDE